MTQSDVCSLEERQLALRRALESHTFARSEQLKAFLRYICEAEMLRPGAPLTEYIIGVEVLGRSEGYSPAEDSSVRTRAYELRQKLERLYTRELQDEPVQICVPKGTYSPHFVHRARSLESVATISIPLSTPDIISHPQLTGRPSRKSGWIITLAVLITAALASAVTWRVLHSASSIKPESAARVLAEAWGPLAANDGTVIMCLATPLSMVVGPQGHQVFGSKDYPVPDEVYSIFKEHRPLAPSQKMGLTLTDNMIAVGTLNAALITAQALKNFGTSYQMLPERVATVSALRGRNAVLFGAAVDSEAITRALADMPLNIDFEPSVSEFVVRDQSSHQFTAPKKSPTGDFTEVLGLLTVKVAKDGDRKPIQSVVFSGITSVGIQGAAEYFSSAAAMSNLRALFGREGIKGFPASYQVVVRCAYSNQLLLSVEYLTHRVVRSAT